MKLIGSLRRSLTCCSSASSSTVAAAAYAAPTVSIKNRLSAKAHDLFSQEDQDPYQHRRRHHQEEEDQDQDSLIDAASSLHNHNNSPPSPTPSLLGALHLPFSRRQRRSSSASVVIGTIFGRRRGRVVICVQSDPLTPPPFLYELSVSTEFIAREMNSGLVRIALGCRRTRGPSHEWKVYFNGQKVGYAMRRQPSERQHKILQVLKTTTAGAGVLSDGCDGGSGGKAGTEGDQEAEGEVLYMRGRYEKVVGSKDSVAYHLINPGGEAGSPQGQQQQLSIFLLRTTDHQLDSF